MKIKNYVNFNRYALFFLLAFFLEALPLHAQQVAIIKGAVRDSSTNEPIGSVTVSLSNGKVTTQTNQRGEFQLEAQLPNSAQFKSVGYRSYTVPISNTNPLVVRLVRSSENLEEVVVIGYGTQKKSSLTAAVSTLKGEEVKNVPVANLSNTLGGRVPGVIVKQGSGEPGRDGSNIYIRGISSIGATQPLIIIDGIPRDYNQFTQMDPNSVESFTVLKDAAAVAPYGVAGANGVILVTSKRGKLGTPTLSYNGYIGFQNPTVLPDYVHNIDYAILRNAAAKNDGLPEPFSVYALQKFRDGTDPDVFPTEYVWDYLISKNAPLTAHNIEISGGTDRVKYYGSLGYQYQAGMWTTTSNNRYNLNMNLDAKVSNTTQISLGINGRIQKFVYPPSDYPGLGTGRIFELAGYSAPVYGPFEFSNGMYGTYVSSGVFGTGYYQNYNTSINTQLSLTQELPFLKGLSLKGTIAFDPTYVDDKTWRTPMHVATIDTTKRPYVITDGIFNDPKANLSQSYNRSQQLTYQAGLYYKNNFGRHNLNIVSVFEAKNNQGLNFGASRRNYDLLVDELNLGSSNPQDWGTSGSSRMAKQVGLVYRVAYDYAGKYMVEASGRYDGSYYFAPKKRFGFFPAFSVGWRLSEESFMKEIKAIDNLKIRASYGEVGALAGNPFQYMSTYNIIGGNYVVAGAPVMGVSERIEPNPVITWERARKTDIGLELGMWKGLLNIEADYFHEKRSNMLISPNVVVPAEYGIGLSQVNAGVMSNSGFEFLVSTAYPINDDLRIGLSGNLTYAKNKLIQVFETSATYDNPNRRQTGRPLGTQFGYESLGFFQESDFDSNGNLKTGIAIQPWGKVFPGDIRYRDMNGDGQINENDLTVIGDPVAAPRIIFGFTPSVSYKNLTLDILFQGAAKVNYYYHPSSIMPFFNGMNAYNFNFDYWTPDNPDAKYPRLTSNPMPNNTQISSFWMESAAYLRMKSINIAYNLPNNWLKNMHIQAARVFASGQNLFTWTKLLYDPELGNNTSYLPTSAWTYPQQKVISFGVNVTF